MHQALPLVIRSSPSICRFLRIGEGGTQIIITHSDLTERIRSVQKTINSGSRRNRQKESCLGKYWRLGVKHKNTFDGVKTQRTIEQKEKVGGLL